jgi:hypothetical protein
MKKVFVLAALLVAASACAPAENTNTTVNTNIAATPAATATPAGVSDADIIAREKAVWEAIKTKNYDTMEGMLTDDFIYVTEDGVHDKKASMDIVKKFEFTEYTLSDFKVIKIDDDAYAVTFSAVAKGTMDGKPLSGKPERDSSAWINRGGKWVAAYHQDTSVMEMPMPTTTPAASNTNSAAPSSSASPASSPAAPTSATEAEKAVWETFKRKDYDAFANYLASTFLEVEPEKVYDKAESVEGVKMLDASKFTLSDFKEVKLDADATVVTYMVTGPNPKGKIEKGRHSSIWSNRGGKWTAYLHQGTPATK